MVLEHITNINKIVERKIYAFLLGFLYSFIALLVSLYVFQNYLLIPAIAFTALLFLPLINRLLKIEKDIEKKSSKFNLRKFFNDHNDIFQIYLYIFIGISFSFSLFSMFVPNMMLTNLIHGNAGTTMALEANASELIFDDFWMIFTNNLKVLIICYFASFLFGTGAIFIISWNASVWGITYGVLVRNASEMASANPFVQFMLLSIIFLPHVLIEASAYFLSGISGGIVSKAATGEKLFSKSFDIIIKKSLLILVLSIVFIFIGALVESQITSHFFNLMF